MRSKAASRCIVGRRDGPHAQLQLGHDAEGAFAALEERRLELGTFDRVDDLAPRQHDLGAHHVRGKGPVPEAADAVAFHVEPAAHGGGGSAGGVGEERESAPPQPRVQLVEAGSRADPHRPGIRIEADDAAQPVQVEHDAAANGDGVPEGGRGRSARGNRHAVPGRIAKQSRDLFRRDGSGDAVGHCVGDQARQERGTAARSRR